MEVLMESEKYAPFTIYIIYGKHTNLVWNEFKPGNKHFICIHKW